MQIYLKLFFIVSIFLSTNKIQPMTQQTDEYLNSNYDYEMYNFLGDSESFKDIEVSASPETIRHNINIDSVYDLYSDRSYIPKSTQYSYQNQTAKDDKKEAVDNDISYYDYLTKNETIEKKPTQIIICEDEEILAPKVIQTKVDRILSSAICNPDHGMQAAVNFIISGENVNDQDNSTKTSPLHFAAQWNAYKLGTILIAAGADINSQDIYGNTPLHILALYSNVDGNNEFAKILLNAGTDLFIKDNDGKTAAKIALELEKTDLYNLIQKINSLRLIS